MSTKIGHFEILSELARSSTGAVYKANDPQSGQTVALKAIELSAFGESASALEQSLLQEAETTKALSSSNLAPVFGAGEIEGKFCAAMEYIQGNSIATMLARKEGFSIWDLLDIGRQVCAGLDHAHSKNVFHYNLEPAKIMCGWDGTVKILGFGVSSVGKFTKQIPGPAPSILQYMSPEQVRDEAIDGRSNLFTLGAMFYEMVTDRKAFDREDPESLRQSILESTPVPPMHVNAKVHPLLSDLIMKALDKDPAKRYQRGRELLDDLEKCKESKPQAAKKPAEAPKGLIAPEKAKSAAQAKSGAATSVQPGAARPATPATGRTSAPKSPATQPSQKKFVVPPANQASQPAQPTASSRIANKPSATAAPKAAAAAAGWGGNAPASSVASEIDPSNQFITSCVKATISSTESRSPNMSSEVADEPEIETFAPDAPKIAIDPMMAEAGPSRGHSTSFSEIAELPPLKEVYIAPEPPPRPLSSVHAAEPSVTMYQGMHEAEEKPRVQPREVAQKALKEIKGVPPRLMLYSVAGAVVLILVIVAVLYFKYSGTGDDDGGAARPAAAASAAQPASSQPAPESRQPEPAAAAPSEPAEPQPETESAAAQPAAASRIRNARKKPAPAPVVVPGQMAVESTPPGALVQVDGKGDPSWVTPFAMSGMKPGQHSITVSKAGYSTDTRTVEISSGSKSNVILHLAQLTAFLAVKSDPTGANIYVDGKDMGKTTPAQVNVDKGSHVILIRKMGYIDETTQAQFVLGQTVNYSPSLRPMGNVDNIKTVGKMKKLFGGNGGQPGQATISIRTQPKGAQISINQHMVEKGTPVEILLDPGNYVLDITLSGYAPVHKVITAEKGGKLVVDETLQPQ